MLYLRSLCQCLGFPKQLITKLFNRQYPKIRDAVIIGDLLKVIKFHQQNYPTSSNQDQNLLHVAIVNKRQIIIEYILTNMNSVMIQDKTIDGDTPLILAILGNNLTLVQTLIEKGANVNVRQNQGTTPFIIAAANGYLDILEYLLFKGANPKLKNFKGETALHRCCYYGHMHILKYVLKNEQRIGLRLGKKDRYGNNCLHSAAEGLSVNVLQYILKLLENQDLFAQENEMGESVYDILERQFNLIKHEDVAVIEKKDILRKLRSNKFDLQVRPNNCISKIVTEGKKSIRSIISGESMISYDNYGK